MKKFFLFFLMIGALVSCSITDDSENVVNELNGKWKLQSIMNFSGDTYDLNSNQEVVYHFTNDMNLVIESNVLVDQTITDYLELAMTSNVMTYDFYFDDIYFMSNAVRVQNENVSLGTFLMQRNNDSLVLHVYDGPTLKFTKVN